LSTETCGYRGKTAGLFSIREAEPCSEGKSDAAFNACLYRIVISGLATPLAAIPTQSIDSRASSPAAGISPTIIPTGVRSSAVHSAASGAPLRQRPPRQSLSRQGKSPSRSASSSQGASLCGEAPPCHPSGRASHQAHDPPLPCHDLPSDHAARHMPRA